MVRITVSIFEDRRQLEAHNFETAQHSDKWISYKSSRINVLQNRAKQGAITRRVIFYNLARKWSNEKWCT